MRILGWMLLVIALLTFWLPFFWVIAFPCGLIGAILLIAAAIRRPVTVYVEVAEAPRERISNSAFGR